MGTTKWGTASFLVLTIIFILLLTSACGNQQTKPVANDSQATVIAKGSEVKNAWPVSVSGIASYRSSDRNEMLVEGAKKEKEVVLYTSENAPFVQPLLDAFMKKYPYIKATVLRLQSEELVPKLLTEIAAGKTPADVVSTGLLLPLITGGHMEGFYTPEAQDIPDEFKHPQGFWIARHLSDFGFAYNTKLVPPDKIPKTFEDLLDPWWQGKFSLEPWDSKFFLGLIHGMGEEKGWEYIKQLAANKPVLAKGKTGRVNMVIAGQEAGTLGIYLASAATLKNKDTAPVENVVLNPTISSPHMVGLVKKTPHPNAAMLLIDFLLSEESQQLEADQGNSIVVRKGVLPKPDYLKKLVQDLNQAKRTVLLEEWYDNLTEVEKRINEIFGL